MASDFDLTDEDIRAAARYWMSSAIWQERFEKAIDRQPPGVLKAYREEMPERLLDICGDHGESIPHSAARIEQAAAALHFAGYAEQSEPATLKRVADVLVELIERRVSERIEKVFRPELTDVARPPLNQDESPTPASQVTPLLSEHLSEWQRGLEQGWKDVKAVSAHSAKQYAVGARLFIEIVGDKRIADISFDDVEHFRETILRLPKSHGKGRHVHAIQAIINAEQAGVARMSMKTAKRHVTALNRYVDWLTFKKLIPRALSPFRGHSFPGSKPSAKDRDDWTAEQLQRLFTARDYLKHARDSAWHWLPLIALHSGMRLEEICRLRPQNDVQIVNGIPCFVIQAHEDGWDPKTESGSRQVPIHPWLIEHGFLRLVELRRTQAAERVFPELRLQQNKLGAQFSRDFSRFKIALGFGPRNVFHSFRHTFRTAIENAESVQLKEAHINAVMGHEGEGAGTGRIYTKRIAARLLQKVVNAFDSPLSLDFLNDESQRTSGKREHVNPRKT